MTANRTNRKIDIYLGLEKKAKRKRYLIYAIFAVVMGGILVYSQTKNFERIKTSKMIVGIMQTMQETKDSDGNPVLVFHVQLDDGKMVKGFSSEKIDFKTDSKVVLDKQELESGRIKYVFQRYE